MWVKWNMSHALFSLLLLFQKDSEEKYSAVSAGCNFSLSRPRPVYLKLCIREATPVSFTQGDAGKVRRHQR